MTPSDPPTTLLPPLTPEETKRLIQQETVSKLVSYGFEPRYIAAALSIPYDQIHLLVCHTRTNLLPEDQALTEGIRVLAWQCLNRASLLLELGTTDVQLSIIKSVLPAISKLLGKETETATEGLHAAERIFESMRNPQPKEPYASIAPAPEGTYDPDEDDGGSEVPD